VDRHVKAVFTILLVLAVSSACSSIGSLNASLAPTATQASSTTTPAPGSNLSSPDTTPLVSTELPGYVAPAEATALIDECGVVGSIQAYFRIPAGSSYHSILPAMGFSPELEGVDNAFVVVYSGQVDLKYYTGIPGASPQAHVGVLCVLLPSGEPVIYENVSRNGMTLPPGAHIGAPGAG
jgi:hypothetical protein